MLSVEAKLQDKRGNSQVVEQLATPTHTIWICVIL